jgi:hypothetical protein
MFIAIFKLINVNFCIFNQKKLNKIVLYQFFDVIFVVEHKVFLLFKKN